MSFAAWSILACSAAFAAFSALSLAMERHYESVFGRGRTLGRERQWLRSAGVAGLVLSCAASLAGAGNAQGWVLWCGVLTVAALSVALLQTYAPRHLVRAVLFAAAVAAATLLA